MNIFKPIGVDELCATVETICANPYPYKITGIKPPHFAVAIDPGNGRTTILEYISDMYKENGVIDFTGGIADYAEITLDGTLQQLYSCINTVKHSADYTNGVFKGIVGIDATKISSHQNETQAKEFEAFFENVADSAVIVLFTPVNMTASELRYTDKIKSKLDDVIDFGSCVYSDTDYSKIVLRYLEDSGVGFVRSEPMVDTLLSVINTLGVDSVPKAIKLAKDLIIKADYSNVIPSISDKQISEYYKSISVARRRI